MNFPQLAGIGVLIAGITAGWGYVRMAAAWVASLMVCRVVVSGESSKAMLAYCWQRSTPSPFGPRIYGGFDNYVHPPRRVITVGFENISDSPALFWFGRSPVIVRRSSFHHMGGASHNLGGNSNPENSIELMFFRRSISADKIIGDAIDYYNEVRSRRKNGSNRCRFFVRRIGGRPHSNDNRMENAARSVAGSPVGLDQEYQQQVANGSLRMLKWKDKDLIAVEDGSPFDSYPFPAHVDEAVSELRRWQKSEEWFKNKGIPWRRGWLLHGLPGCGKSTMIRAIATDLDMPLFVFDLATLDNASFHDGWTDVMSYAPCCVLFEDIDTVFNGRVNIAVRDKQQMGLTFDCLLNTISGVEKADGVLVFVTTNKLESIDPALGVSDGLKSTRPGRIDRIISLGVMEEKERRRLADRILGDFPDVIAKTVKAGSGETASQFSDRCTQLALSLFWKEKA